MLAAGLVLALSLMAVVAFGPDKAFRYALSLYLVATATPYERPMPGAAVVQVLGDSTGYGTGAARPEESIAGRLGAAYPAFEIRNDSGNGRTIGGLRARLEGGAVALPERARLVLLQIGGNDILIERPLPEVRADLDAVLGRIAPQADAVIMICCGNINGETAPDGALIGPARPYHALYAEAAAAYGARYLDLSEPDGVSPFIQDRAAHIAIDDLHPNGAGYGHWFTLLAPTLQEALDD